MRPSTDQVQFQGHQCRLSWESFVDEVLDAFKKNISRKEIQHVEQKEAK